jgi:hypothetical protein
VRSGGIPASIEVELTRDIIVVLAVFLASLILRYSLHYTLIQIGLGIAIGLVGRVIFCAFTEDRV